ncbi:PrgI family protein [Candidatus Woesebacteria bacterium]|nr:PrgI family protein [Candidatus Woesebacteria bacterium]
MEQHPIPQNISSYQFRLVGDMTLKQFFQLAGGAVISLIFYSTPLHPLIKWPIMLFFALAGVALAFLPFEDRPLEKWVVAFFRSIYSPTVFMWKRSSPPIKYFKDEVLGQEEVPAAGGAEAEKMKKYLAETVGSKTPFANKLDSFEKNFLSGIGSLFGVGQVTPQAGVSPSIVEPEKKLSVPQTGFVKVVAPKTSTEEKVTSPVQAPPPLTTDTISPLASKGFGVTKVAEFSDQAAPPTPPTVPNTVNGQVLDSLGKIVESAILEIRDSGGRPVRALRTNKLGHFMVVTPLVSGPYELFVEKDGLEFDPVRFDAMGEIISPIVIRASSPRVKKSPAGNQQAATPI